MADGGQDRSQLLDGESLRPNRPKPVARKPHHTTGSCQGCKENKGRAGQMQNGKANTTKAHFIRDRAEESLGEDARGPELEL